MLIALENRASGCNSAPAFARSDISPARHPESQPFRYPARHRSARAGNVSGTRRRPFASLHWSGHPARLHNHKRPVCPVAREYRQNRGNGAYKTRPCLHPAMRPRQTPGINVPMKTKGRDQFCAAAQYPNDPQPYAARSDIGRRSPAQARLPPETVLLDKESTAAPLKADLDLVRKTQVGYFYPDRTGVEQPRALPETHAGVIGASMLRNQLVDGKGLTHFRCLFRNQIVRTHAMRFLCEQLQRSFKRIFSVMQDKYLNASVLIF